MPIREGVEGLLKENQNRKISTFLDVQIFIWLMYIHIYISKIHSALFPM